MNYNSGAGLASDNAGLDNQGFVLMGISNTLVSSIQISSTSIPSSDLVGYSFFAKEPCDVDEDNVDNSLDLDSDDDGIADILEAGGTDGDGDGQMDYGTAGDPSTMTDVDSDGLSRCRG